jgi:hypothetical protein
MSDELGGTIMRDSTSQILMPVLTDYSTFNCHVDDKCVMIDLVPEKTAVGKGGRKWVKPTDAIDEREGRAGCLHPSGDSEVLRPLSKLNNGDTGLRTLFLFIMRHVMRMVSLSDRPEGCLERQTDLTAFSQIRDGSLKSSGHPSKNSGHETDSRFRFRPIHPFEKRNCLKKEESVAVTEECC